MPTRPSRIRGLDWANVHKDRVGVYLGITEHGNVETENEIYEISKFDYDTKVWSHHHNPAHRRQQCRRRSDAQPRHHRSAPDARRRLCCGECRVHSGVQMLRLGEVDLAIAGGVSESIHTFGIFASFAARGRSPGTKTRRKRAGPSIWIATASSSPKAARSALSSGCPMRSTAGPRSTREIVGYAMNSDATDFVLPDAQPAGRVHAAGTGAGGHRCPKTSTSSAATRPPPSRATSRNASPAGGLRRPAALAINNTKSFIGHAMGAAGAWSCWGTCLPLTTIAHATINLDDKTPLWIAADRGQHAAFAWSGSSIILNNSFGMLGINSVLIVKKFPRDAGGRLQLRLAEGIGLRQGKGR